MLKPRFGFIINNYALVIEKVLSGQVDKLIIAPLFGFAILGNYALSMQILSIATILPSIVFQYTLSQDASGKSSSWIKKFSILSHALLLFYFFYAFRRGKINFVSQNHQSEVPYPQRAN